MKTMSFIYRRVPTLFINIFFGGGKKNNIKKCVHIKIYENTPGTLRHLKRVWSCESERR